MAAAIAIGSMIFAVVLLLPSMKKLPEHKGLEEHSTSYKSLELLAPTVFACLLALIGTGIYFLLENYTAQVELKPGYYDLFGVKLVCVVAAFFLSIYQTFNLRTRIADLDLSPENRKLVPETIEQMIKITKLTLTAFSLALFFGVWMARY